MSPRAKQIAVIGISWFLAVGFLLAGGTKLAGMEMQVEDFRAWGYPVWFMYLTGTLEVLAAVLIFVPPTRFYGALLLVVIMIGAAGTHLWHEEWVETIMPVIPLVLAGFVAYQTRPGGGAARPGGGGGRSLRRPIA